MNLLHPFSSDHTENSDNDEGDAEQLSHIEGQAVLEIHLIDFGEFNEETSCENQREAQTEEKAGTHFLRSAAVDEPSHKEEYLPSSFSASCLCLRTGASSYIIGLCIYHIM